VRRFLTSVAVIAGVLCAGHGLAQDVTEGALKGAFLYNFAIFTEWPPDVLPAGMPIQVCVVGDRAVASALERHAAGRQIAGHNVVVTTPGPNDKTVQTCHVLYVAAGARGAAEAVTAVAGSPVLTISDVDEFARVGGIAQFFVEGGKMRFRVNVASAKRAHLQLSSRLLSLAELVHD
jgi:YfiR/HmsC-like